MINVRLLPQSFAARAVALAKHDGQRQFLVSGGVMREVQQLLNKVSPDEARLALAGERVNHLLQWLAASFIADDDSSAAPASIPKNDRHVYHAACRAGAAVLTADAGLWLGCRACNLPVFLPLELIRQWDGMALSPRRRRVRCLPVGIRGACTGARVNFSLVHFSRRVLGVLRRGRIILGGESVSSGFGAANGLLELAECWQSAGRASHWLAALRRILLRATPATHRLMCDEVPSRQRRLLHE